MYPYPSSNLLSPCNELFQIDPRDLTYQSYIPVTGILLL